MRESAKFELACLKKEEEEEEEEEENRFWRFGDFLAWYFRDGYSRHWESSGPGKHSKTNSKLSYLPPVFEIWRDLGRFFCISFNCVSVVSLHIESTDSMIAYINPQN